MTGHARPGWPWAVLAVAALLTLGSVLSVLRLRPEGGLDGMLDPRDPAVHAMSRVLRDFPLADELLVFASLPPGDTATEKLTDFAARLEARCRELTVVRAVRWRPPPDARGFVERVMAPAGLLYLGDAQLDQAKARLTPDAMRQQLARDAAMLAAPGPAAGGLAKVIVQDPLRLHEFLFDSLDTAGLPSVGGDALYSKDGHGLLVRVEGARPSSDLDAAAALTRAVRSAVDAANTDGLHVSITGAYAIAAHNAALIRGDSIESTVVGVVGLAAVFGLFYRRPVRTFLLAFTPVAVGLLWGFGAYALLRSTVTPLAAVVGGALGGVGIDYSVHLMAHRRTGETPAGTTRRMFAPLLAAWATSVIGFAVVAWSPLRLLRDFALIGSLGLAGAWVSAMTVLPALLTLVGDEGDGVAATRGRPATRLMPLVARRPGLLALIGGGVGVVLVVAAAWAATGLRQDTDLTALHPRPNAPLDALDEVNRRMGFGGASFVLRLTAGTDDELLRRAWQVRRALADAGVSVFGPASLLPDPDAAAARFASPPVTDVKRVVADFRAAVETSDFGPRAFDSYAAALPALLRPARAPGLADLRQYPELARTVLPATNVDGPAALAVLTPRAEPRTPEDVERTVALVRGKLAGVPGATLTGLSVLASDARAGVRRDTPRVAVTAVVAVAVFLLAHLRSVTLAALTIVPTMLSFATVLLTMWLSGVGLNLVNLVLFPLLLGINVDYGIFATDVLRRRVRDRAGERFLAATTALLACAATTVLGFGSLVTVSVPAVRSLGWLITAGLLACVVGALVVLWPAVLRVARRRGRE